MRCPVILVGDALQLNIVNKNCWVSERRLARNTNAGFNLKEEVFLSVWGVNVVGTESICRRVECEGLSNIQGTKI